MKRERISFYADSLRPLRLEGILELPEGQPPFPACILCHPHPIGGGSMHVPLLVELAGVLTREGWACLRFNFRGVGRSGGESTGGVSEIEDIQGADNWLRDRGDIRPDDISLAGWSFGSWVGLRWALQGGRCRNLALISPPLIGFDFFNFMGDLAAGPGFGSLVISGEQDQFSTRERLEELARKLGAELYMVRGADHFLFGREREVAEVIARNWKQPSGQG